MAGGDTRPAVRRIAAGNLVAEIVPELGGGLARFDLIRGWPVPAGLTALAGR